MTPTRPAPPAAPKPSKAAKTPSASPDTPTGVVAQPASTPPAPTTTRLEVLSQQEHDLGCEFIFSIDPQITRRLLTRTGRATREQMWGELPKYVERIVKRALENEVY